MGKTVYTVVGQTSIRPEGLPEGLSVEATTSEFRKEVSGFLVEDSVVTPGNAFIYQELTGASRHITRADVVALRDVLTEWLNDSVPSLRVIHDSTDSAGSTWRWYEIAPDKFVYYRLEDDARSETKSGANSDRDGLTYEQVKNDYNIRTVSAWKV